jgi:hypothetical protein
MSQLRPIEWTEDRGFTAAEQFRKRNDPYDIKDKELILHVALMLERLRFQRVHYKCKGPSPEFMVERSLLQGPKFTNDWASGWKQGRFTWADVDRLDPVLDEVIEVEFNSYNETYCPFFFIFWKDSVDDYLAMFQGVPRSDNDSLQQLEDEVAAMSESLLPDGVFETPDEVIWAPSSSNGFENAERSRPEWEIEFDDPSGDYISDHLQYLRGQAMKRPSEVRDIGTMTPQSIRLHRKIMYPMQKACRRIPGCVYGRDQQYIKKRVEEIGSSNYFFFMRDYTKSGMTMPLKVREAIIKGFYRRDPKLAEKYCFAFRRQILFYKDGDDIKRASPDTGSPLGMFVEGFTLMQYAVDRIIQRTLGFKVDFCATNDDMIVGHRNEERLREYCNHDTFFQTDLGMLVKASKSGLSHNRFFFCEEYWDMEYIMSKEVLTSLALIGAKYSINVVHAKELVNSILLSLPYWSDIVRTAVREVITSFDYEFSEQEHQWPYLFGGWWPTYRDGLDSSIEWRNGDFIADAAYWACREQVKKCKELREGPSLAYSRKKQIRLLQVPENQSDYLSLIPLFGTKGALQDYYSLMSRRPLDLQRYYKRLWICRQSKFTRIINGKDEAPDITSGYLRRHPNSVIILGLSGLKVRPKIETIYRPMIGLTLSSGDARLSCLAQLGYISFPDLKKTSKTEKALHRLGMTSELAYQKINIPSGGCSSFLMSNELRGLDDFQNRTNLAICTIDDDDIQMQSTERWTWVPDLPFQWVLRCDTYSRLLKGAYLSKDTGPFWERFIQKKHSVAEPWGYEDPVPEQIVYETSTWEEEFIDQVRSLLDCDALQIKAKLVPLSSTENRSVIKTDFGVAVASNDSNLYSIGEGSYIDPNSISISMWDRESGSEDEIGDWFGG